MMIFIILNTQVYKYVCGHGSELIKSTQNGLELEVVCVSENLCCFDI